MPAGWWSEIPENFRIFTQLPILERDMAWLPTLNALAAIDPEPSGDDVSFYAVNGELKTLEGFVPPAHYTRKRTRIEPFSTRSGDV